MWKLPENLRCRPRKCNYAVIWDNGLYEESQTVVKTSSGPSESAEPERSRKSGQECNRNISKPKTPAITDLPTELFDAFYDLLDLVSVVRFRQTCRALYYHGMDMCRLILRLRSASYPDYADFKFARLCFAERSYTKSPCQLGMLLCGGCETYHSEGSFSDEERKKQPEERVCVGQMGRVFFTPEHSVSFRELQLHFGYIHSLAIDIRKESQYGWRPLDNTHRPSPYLVSPIYHQCGSPYGHRFDYFWRFDISRDSEDVITRQSVKKILRSRSVDLCPHIQSDDPLVIDAINRCRHKHIYIHKMAQRVSCPRCKMQACVLLRAVDPWSTDYESQHRVIVHVTRYIGQIPSPNASRHVSLYNCDCSGDDRKAMQPQWLMQIDQPKLRTPQRFSKEKMLFVRAGPELARGYRRWFRHFDNTAEHEWGPCGQW